MSNNMKNVRRKTAGTWRKVSNEVPGLDLLIKPAGRPHDNIIHTVTTENGEHLVTGFFHKGDNWAQRMIDLQTEPYRTQHSGVAPPKYTVKSHTVYPNDNQEPPGENLAKALTFLLNKKTYELIIAPAIADEQREFDESSPRRQKWIRVRIWILVIKNLLAIVPGSLLDSVARRLGQ